LCLAAATPGAESTRAIVAPIAGINRSSRLVFTSSPCESWVVSLLGPRYEAGALQVHLVDNRRWAPRGADRADAGDDDEGDSSDLGDIQPLVEGNQAYKRGDRGL
jgi:hypothetical protein